MAALLSFFSPSRSHPELHVFGGNGSQSARTPAPTTDPPSDDRLDVPRSRSFVYPSTAAPVQCCRGERERPNHAERKTAAAAAAATATVYTLQWNRELTYALETGARALPLPPALASLIACCLQTAP